MNCQALSKRARIPSAIVLHFALMILEGLARPDLCSVSFHFQAFASEVIGNTQQQVFLDQF
jgi:hypothetical protein